jgi:hypothetical protein
MVRFTNIFGVITSLFMSTPRTWRPLLGLHAALPCVPSDRWFDFSWWAVSRHYAFTASRSYSCSTSYPSSWQGYDWWRGFSLGRYLFEPFVVLTCNASPNTPRHTPHRPMSSTYYCFIYLFIFSGFFFSRCYPSMIYMKSDYKIQALIPPKDVTPQK